MKSKTLMGIIMIIIGAAIMIIGIIMVASKDKNAEQSSIMVTINNDGSGYQEYNKDLSSQDKSHKEQYHNMGSPSGQQYEESIVSPSKVKGNNFEDFVANLLADWRLSLITRTRDDASSAGVVPESSLNPDLHVRQKRNQGSIDYYLECKYRSKWDDGVVKFEKWQIDRYHEFQRKENRKVIIALGVGGSPSKPQTFMLVPLDSVRNQTIRKIDTKYVVQPNPSALIEYMNSYFTTVFDKAKEKK